MMGTKERNVLDYEEVIHVLSESHPDISKDDPDVLVYLSDLGSLGLARLIQEPERLAEEKISVLEQTQDLAFHNYKTFIQAAECSQKIFQDFNVIESRLDLLVNKLPDFKQKCGEFGKEAQHINARWKQASLTLAKHQQLLEFLEMPQLMDNYVKAGLYDEALELSAYVKRLERKHLDISLIKNIITDIQAGVSMMLIQLLAKLQTNIQLPECLKIVGYLRRMDVFSEIELRVKFLQARDTWFKKVVEDIAQTDPYQHVIKVIESSRIHLFDIITQYRAIFSDDDSILLIHDNSKHNCAIFHSWMSKKISWFLHVLDNDLSSNLGGRIDTVFAQCMYFGLSFSRVNVDFRPLLIAIFENAVFYRYQSELEIANKKFEKSIIKYNFSSYSNTAILVPSFSSEDSLQPPSNLLDFHPLAQYCNDVLSAFNNLKLCCSFSMSADIVRVLTLSLQKIIQLLLDIYNRYEINSSEQEKEHLIKFCCLFSSELIPHFNKCLSMLFPPESMSQVLGITSMEFKKIEDICKLKYEILKPLDIILPNKDDDSGDDGLIIEFKNNDIADQQKTLPLDDNSPATVDLPLDSENLSNESRCNNNDEKQNVPELEVNKVPDVILDEASVDSLKENTQDLNPELENSHNDQNE